MQKLPEYALGGLCARHSLVSAGLAAFVGGLDGALAGARSSQSVLVSAGLGAVVLLPFGASLGILQALIVHLAKRPVQRSIEARLTSLEDRVRFLGLLIAAGVSAAVSVVGYVWLSGELGRIKEESLRAIVDGAAIVGLLLGYSALVPFLLPMATGAALRFATRFGLPFPHSSARRAALYYLLPCGAVSWFMFYNYGAKLGVLSWLLAAACFLAGGAVLLRLTRAAVDSIRVSVWALCISVAFLAALGAGSAALDRWPGGREVSSRAWVLPFAVDALRRWTDIDGDGQSALFGGGDCAAWDPARSPARAEIADNGIDEDCSGSDLVGGLPASQLRRFSSQFAPEQARRLNVLWFIVDSLRPDHLTPYGYAHNTTPYLQQLARDAWVFEHAYSQSSTTPLSVPSMLSGRWPGRMQWTPGQFPMAESSERLLPELLLAQGYQTTLIQNAWLQHKLPGLARGFSSVRTAPAAANWKSGEYALSNTWLAIEAARTKSDPFFIAVHMDDVHHPYTAHRGYPLLEFAGLAADPRGYNRGIALADILIRLSAAHLKNAGLWEDTLLVVTADHGEEFGEHGGSIHSATCYREVTHVPLIVRAPGFGAERVSSRVALVDLVPTVLELLGLQEQAWDLDGQSLLVPVLELQAAPKERPIYCSIHQLFRGRKPFFSRTVRDGRYMLAHEMLSNRFELYDTQTDPGETTDLSAKPEFSGPLRTLKAQLSQSERGNLFTVGTK